MGRIKKRNGWYIRLLALALCGALLAGCGEQKQEEKAAVVQETPETKPEKKKTSDTEGKEEIAKEGIPKEGIPKELLPGQAEEQKAQEASGDEASGRETVEVWDASGGSTGQAEAGGSGQAESPAEAKEIRVSVSVESGNADGSVLAAGTVTLQKGATAYDALDALLGGGFSASGGYVTGIGGLSEKDFGAQSGWMYSVNGSYPGAGSSSYVLKDGDAVAWRYTTNGGKDL